MESWEIDEAVSSIARLCMVLRGKTTEVAVATRSGIHFDGFDRHQIGIHRGGTCWLSHDTYQALGEDRSTFSSRCLLRPRQKLCKETKKRKEESGGGFEWYAWPLHFLARLRQNGRTLSDGVYQLHHGPPVPTNPKAGPQEAAGWFQLASQHLGTAVPADNPELPLFSRRGAPEEGQGEGHWNSNQGISRKSKHHECKTISFIMIHLVYTDSCLPCQHSMHASLRIVAFISEPS
jgi:hypothetical protein